MANTLNTPLISSTTLLKLLNIKLGTSFWNTLYTPNAQLKRKKKERKQAYF